MVSGIEWNSENLRIHFTQELVSNNELRYAEEILRDYHYTCSPDVLLTLTKHFTREIGFQLEKGTINRTKIGFQLKRGTLIGQSFM